MGFSPAKLFLSIHKQNLVLGIILFIIALLTYQNILSHELFFDDEELIYKNRYVQSFEYFPKYFTENMIAGAGKISNMYRPVLLTSFAIDYFFWKNNPFGYHLTSIILHGLNSILIFYLIQLVSRKKIISFLTSLLFVIHPVQTEAVAYAAGRTDPLYSFFALTCLVGFIYFWEKNKFPGLFISLASFVLAILAKESAIIVPFLILLMIFVIKPAEQIKRNKLLWLFPYILISAIYVYLRLTIFNFSNTLNFFSSETLYSTSLLVRLFTFSKVFFDYVYLLIFPRDLISGREAEVISSLINIWVLLFLILVSLMVYLLLTKYKRNKLFYFSFFWFFITILPVAGIIPINNIEAEHYLYLPSLSFYLLVSCIFVTIWDQIKSLNKKIIILIIFLSVAFSYYLRTIIRIKDWKDPITFYSRSLKQTPGHLIMRHNLAMAYADKNDLARAVNGFKQVIALSRNTLPHARYNLANVYLKLGWLKEAEEEYYQALKIDPNFLFSYYALLNLYRQEGNNQQYEKITDKLKSLGVSTEVYDYTKQ